VFGCHNGPGIQPGPQRQLSQRSPGTGADPLADPKLGDLRDTAADANSRSAGRKLGRGSRTDRGRVRGREGRPTRPVPAGGHVCDIGAIESGAQRLRVCPNCDYDPLNLTFGDVQMAIDWAIAGDTVAIEAGVYTGNFVAYKDLTLEHAGIDVTLLNRDQPTDVRAILQASDRSIREQRGGLDPLQVTGLSGSVLTTGSCKLTDTTIVPAGDVDVTLRGLTIQHGLAREVAASTTWARCKCTPPPSLTTRPSTSWTRTVRWSPTAEGLGGGIYNTGTLTLERSTISGNQAEYRGGALYTRGQSTSAMST